MRLFVALDLPWALRERLAMLSAADLKLTLRSPNCKLPLLGG